jgi:hypothetical protein
MSREDWQSEKPAAQQALASLGTAQAIYIVASVLATMGWFWFIGWCALQFV